MLLLLVPCVMAAEPYEIPPEKKNHWAWKPVSAVSPPAVKEAAWVKSPIDRFVLAKLEAAGLKPAAPASREVLIRRVAFDLIGLPPTPREIDDFVNDTSPDAWAKVVDRLLASPHYGERWGRHWLDLARYADSNGYEYDEIRPDAWRYRDYVIDSFNADKPYTRFVREQLAGDELAPDDPAAVIATGFNLLGPDMTDSSDQVQRRQNTLTDMTDTTALAFLGLTLGCARCHDHKFEPFPQTDYYRLQAFFTPAKFRADVNIVPKNQRAALAEAAARHEATRKPVRAALDALEGPYRTKLRAAKLAKQSEEVREAHETPEGQRTPAQRERVAETIRFVSVSPAEVLKGMTDEEKQRHKELSDRLKAIEAAKPKVPVAMGLEDGKPEKTYLLERGEPANKGEEVRPGFPIVLTAEKPKIAPPWESTTGRRTALADWIADERNPLAARVMVNRLWHHHFGRGIVRTPSDFGVRGDAPTHPELLDWLAGEFVRGGWSLKRMHKTMLMSATYQQSTTASPDALKADPDNNLFSRMNRQRIEGEIVRDSLLAVSGRLNPKPGGPGVSVPGPAADKGARPATVTADKAEYTRRSVYLFARRNLRNPFLEAFDLPDSNLSCPQRERSTTAPQALALLNDADVIASAKALAAKLKDEPDPVAAVYRITLGRLPTAAEATVAREFLKDSPLSELCRALFNVNEFVYVD
ncbi:protein of unknown function DUF1549 [Fimbriiglobus ruber]|uniref:Cytochrome c domain-containing protein n=1 Tax=Fimbriiglobus ruber TaxID=1908690 RepID=A0A225E5J3_9BACT|nr:protein of unknown function DUF1549 [Fimbriiglobus ruber]